MNGMLGLYCYTATARRELKPSAAPGSPATTEPQNTNRLSDSWWNPLRLRALGQAARV